MSTLSIFVDESGNFNMDDDNGSLYSIAFVFHNQQNIISQAAYNLDMQLAYLATIVLSFTQLQSLGEKMNIQD